MHAREIVLGAWISTLAVFASPLGAAQAFVRGDVNQDRAQDISDPVKILRVLFLGESAPGCLDAIDANDSGELDVSDAVFLLIHLFAEPGLPLSPPYPECGKDPTRDALGCDGFEYCPDLPACRAILEVQPANGWAPLAVKLTAAVAELDAAASEYRWDFDGDGGTDRVTPHGRASFTYATPGAFEARVTVIDDDGECSAQAAVEVKPLPVLTVLGRTVNEIGAPLATARVKAGGSAALSGEDGSFLIEDVPLPPAFALEASKGFLTGRKLVSAGGQGGGGAAVVDAGDVVLGPPYPVGRFPAGQLPIALAVADLNGDEKLDVATANYFSDDVSVLLGKGDGILLPQRVFGAGTNPSSLALADLDGDGTLDVVAANKIPQEQAGQVSLLFGTGNGALRGAQGLDAGDYPNCVAVGDMNGDGIADLVLANGAKDWLTILQGRGDGTFQPPQDVEGRAATSLVLADLDRDGALDVVLARNTFATEAVSVLLANGDGTFRGIQDLAVAGAQLSAVHIAVKDMNSDQVPDIVAANENQSCGSFVNGDVAVLLGAGDGSFRAAMQFPTGDCPWSLAVEDVSQDGAPDVFTITGDETEGELVGIWVHLGKGDGTLQDPRRFDYQGHAPYAVAVAEMNGDGLLDLLTANTASNDVTVMSGLGDGTFMTSQIDQRLAVGLNPRGVAAGDVNGDGALDLATFNFDSFSVLLGNGDGTLGGPTRVPIVGLELRQEQPASMALLDLNLDAAADIVASGGPAGELHVTHSNGDGTFGPVGSTTLEAAASSMVPADLDADGAPDIAMVAPLNDSPVLVLLNNGGGLSLPTTSYRAGAGAVAVAVADLDADGAMDLAVANSGSNDISVFLGNGDGSFRDGPRLEAGGGPRAIASGDLNLDGLPDLATANEGSYDVSVILGAGGGAFGPQSSFPCGAGPVALAVVDLNLDDVPDVITANFGSWDVSILLGNGDGALQPEIRFGTSYATSFLIVADLNADGAPDIITTSTLSSGSVGVVLHQ